MRGCVLAVAVFGLAACEELTNGFNGQSSGISAGAGATGSGLRTLAVLGGDVQVRGPDGYCVDQSASNARRGFAVMAGCALLADDAAVMPNLDGLITVQFGGENTASVTGNEEAFAAFLNSASGRGVLSASGNAADISKVATTTDRGGILVRYEDASGPAFAGTSGTQWRGFLDIDGRLATVSVLSFDRKALGRGEGARLLVVAMAELAEVNAPMAVAKAAFGENG